MAIVHLKTYEALKAAGAPDDKAREAAEEIAAYDNRLAKIEADVRSLKWPIVLAFVAVLIMLFKALLDLVDMVFLR